MLQTTATFFLHHHHLAQTLSSLVIQETELVLDNRVISPFYRQLNAYTRLAESKSRTKNQKKKKERKKKKKKKKKKKGKKREKKPERREIIIYCYIRSDIQTLCDDMNCLSMFSVKQNRKRE